MKLIFLFILTYFMGSLPNGVFVGKGLRGIDIREHGSNNSGATNAFRVLGAKYGLLVLVLDALKGLLPLYIGAQLGVEGNILVILGVTAVIGHTFSPFLKFKGGKGVATSLGIFLYLAPIPMLITLGVFIILVGITKYVSLGSIVSSILLPALLLFMPVNSRVGDSKGVFLISALLGSYIIYKHRANIKRLINGTENKFYKK